jgi:hypothetical protein
MVLGVVLAALHVLHLVRHLTIAPFARHMLAMSPTVVTTARISGMHLSGLDCRYGSFKKTEASLQTVAHRRVLAPVPRREVMPMAELEPASPPAGGERGAG